MKLNEIVELTEVKGSGSFDYKYFFWAKEGLSYGVGYARQEVSLDIVNLAREAETTINNLTNVINAIDKGKLDKLEIAEKKVKANIKRITGIVELFSSPIVISWLSKAKPSIVKIPTKRRGDVTDSNGKTIDVVSLFKDSETREFITDIMDWGKVTINDKDGDTLNTIISKFMSSLFSKNKAKDIRKTARGLALENIMTSLHFKDKNIEVTSFKKQDYAAFPESMVGTKKAPSMLKDVINNNFQKIFKKAKNAFKKR